MLRGFFDESNKSPKDIHFLLAGWTATVEEWEKFTVAWCECLAEAPAIRYFKYSEANILSGEFAKFTRRNSDAKRLALAKVMSLHDLRGYICSADHKMFANKPKELKKLMATRIYDWAFMEIIPTVLQDRIQRNDIQGKIDFIFDRCSELRACIESYERERKKWTERMQLIAGEVIPGDDSELAGLQAADFLVGEMSLHFKTKKPSDIYKAMLTQHLIVQTKVTPPEQLKKLHAYAKEVFQRRELLNDTIKVMKKAGIRLDDFKNL